MEKGKVCVTGGTGYLGSWLVMRLLQHGYSVNTTVRSNNKDLPGASERLRIFEADLAQPHSFRAAIEGCVGVFLVANQMTPGITDTDETVTKLSVASTLEILQACLDTKTVKRAVYTSSAAAAIFTNNNNATTIDEDSWSDLDIIRKSGSVIAPYATAKTSTERAALEFATKHGLDLVTLVPTYIHGPYITPRCPNSVYTLMSMFFGNVDPYKYIPVSIDAVHVDDVASAQIFLLESSHAKGRYICSAVEITVDKLYELLCSTYPAYQVAPPSNLGEIGEGKIYRISSKKLLEIGFSYKFGLKDMYDGAIEGCKRLGLL